MDYKLKCNMVRRDIVTCIGTLGVGHIGGSLSIVEALVALYYKHMNVDPKILKWKAGIVWWFPKATQALRFIQFWPKRIFRQTAPFDAQQKRHAFAFALRYEQDSGRRYDGRKLGARLQLRCGHGGRRQDQKRRRQNLRHNRRRRKSGRTNLGSRYVCGQQASFQPYRFHRLQQNAD